MSATPIRSAGMLMLWALGCLLLPGASLAQSVPPASAANLTRVAGSAPQPKMQLPPAAVACTRSVPPRCFGRPGPEIRGANCAESTCPGLSMCVNTQRGARCVPVQPMVVDPQPTPPPVAGGSPLCRPGSEPPGPPVQPTPGDLPGDVLDPIDDSGSCITLHCGEGAACIELPWGTAQSRPMCIQMIPMLLESDL